MKLHKRTRRASNQDKQEKLSELAEKPPIPKAREMFARQAYAVSPLSYQARQLIRSQGQQIEHKDVAEYMKDRGLKEIGQGYTD